MVLKKAHLREVCVTVWPQILKGLDKQENIDAME
jgi:hypothetical protein